jgi:Zn-dependent peptidase ImmA (M78 family)
LLDLTGGPNGRRFPVDVAELAVAFSRENADLRDEPVLGVSGGDLGPIDGCLMPVADGSGWAILYNDKVKSPGRTLHTQAHEWGHYLFHREAARQGGGLRCAARDIAAGQESRRAVEREADAFAAALLMPFNDFRRQVAARETPDLDRLSDVAIRYGTSLVSTTLRWLEMTGKRALVVAADADYILWARSSTAALQTRNWLKATAGEPIEAPRGSLLAAGVEERTGIRHGNGVWFGEPAFEMCLVPDNYDFRLSVVLLADVERSVEDETDDALAEAVDMRMARWPL